MNTIAIELKVKNHVVHNHSIDAIATREVNHRWWHVLLGIWACYPLPVPWDWSGGAISFLAVTWGESGSTMTSLVVSWEESGISIVAVFLEAGRGAWSALIFLVGGKQPPPFKTEDSISCCVHMSKLEWNSVKFVILIYSCTDRAATKYHVHSLVTSHANAIARRTDHSGASTIICHAERVSL